ncbi:hypothetical protein EON65_30160, partial [archaeon]
MNGFYHHPGSPVDRRQPRYDSAWGNVAMDMHVPSPRLSPNPHYGGPAPPDRYQPHHTMQNFATSHDNSGMPDRNQGRSRLDEFYYRVVATYKTNACMLAGAHNLQTCLAWHSAADRRRNPFEYKYIATQCPHQTEHFPCVYQDSCLYAHNPVECMYHPDVYKRSMCQHTVSEAFCDRGSYCAFAHVQSDLRGMTHAITSGNVISKAEREAAVGVVERLVLLVKHAGSEGVLGSDLPKRYHSLFGEPIDSTAERLGGTGSRVKVKDLLQGQDKVRMELYKGVQPKFVYDLDAKKRG